MAPPRATAAPQGTAPPPHAAFVDVCAAMESAQAETGLVARKATLALGLREGRVAVFLLERGVSSAPINPLTHGTAHARLPWHKHLPLIEDAGTALLHALARHPVWSFLADETTLHLTGSPAPVSLGPNHPTVARGGMLLSHPKLVLAQGLWRETPLPMAAFLALWRDLALDTGDGVERMLRRRDTGGRPVAMGPFSLGTARKLRDVIGFTGIPTPEPSPYVVLEKVLDARRRRGGHRAPMPLPTRVPRAVRAAYTGLLRLERTLPAALAEATLNGPTNPQGHIHGRYTALSTSHARLHHLEDGRPSNRDSAAQACYDALLPLTEAFQRFLDACAEASPCLGSLMAQHPPALTYHPSRRLRDGGAAPTGQAATAPKGTAPPHGVSGFSLYLCGLPVRHTTDLAPFFSGAASQRPYHVLLTPDTIRTVPAPTPRRALAIVASVVENALPPLSVWAMAPEDATEPSAT